MCPVHWSMLGLALLPATLGALGYLGYRLKRAAAPRYDGKAV